VAVRYDPAQRSVTLEHGQAIFAVAHDPARPFRVLAGAAEVVAVGTRFDVYLKGNTTLVTVTEGRVTVDNVAAQEAARPAGRTPVEVTAGQMVRVESGLPPSSPQPIDAARATAWLHRQISFDAAPLGDVAAEFNRYAAVPVEIETPALRSVAVSGVFSVDDTESFVAFLRSLDGVGVEVTPTGVRVFKK
jgi:transmembrane sensor